MLKYGKRQIYIPDPVRARPSISAEDKARAAAEPPHPVPHHCKPWVDGQTAGWTLFYGYLTGVKISSADGRAITVENGDQLTRETQQPRVIDQFAPGHFGISAGYYLRTPPGFVSLLVPAHRAPAGLELVSGIIETDWYPRPIFIVFKAPHPDRPITLDYKDELARVIVVPRQEKLTAEPLSDAEWADMQAAEDAYLQDEETTDSRWAAATGDSFTHIYKQWSQRFRQEGAAAPPDDQ